MSIVHHLMRTSSPVSLFDARANPFMRQKAQAPIELALSTTIASIERLHAKTVVLSANGYKPMRLCGPVEPRSPAPTAAAPAAADPAVDATKAPADTEREAPEAAAAPERPRAISPAGSPPSKKNSRLIKAYDGEPCPLQFRDDEGRLVDLTARASDGEKKAPRQKIRRSSAYVPEDDETKEQRARERKAVSLSSGVGCIFPHSMWSAPWRARRAA